MVNRVTGELITVPCKSWRCPQCSVSNRRAFRKRLRLGLRGSPVLSHATPKLLTLTSLPSEEPVRSRQLLSRRFAELRRRLESALPGCQVEYAGAVELTRRGAVHFHVVLRGVPFMPQPVWSRLAERVGFGPVVDIRRVRSDGVGEYLSKDLGGYLSKDLGARYSWPPHFRRVRFSRDWAPEWVPRRVSAATRGDQPSEWTLQRIDPPAPAWADPVAGQGPP